jgi:hypothetical protein
MRVDKKKKEKKKKNQKPLNSGMSKWGFPIKSFFS